MTTADPPLFGFAGDPHSGSSSSGSNTSKWGQVRSAVQLAQQAKQRDVNKADTLAVSSTTTSASAAFARSLVLFTGFLFRRPSKLFRPTRVDTWAGLRQLALSSDQTLSPSFIRDLLRRKAGVAAITLTLLPPLLVNTTLGFLLFTSHTLFSLGLARLPFFQRPKNDDHATLTYYTPQMSASDPNEQAIAGERGEDPINLETLLRGPSIVPNHPTILSAIAGAGAGLVQGAAFTPVENLVRFLQQSTSSITNIFLRITHLPLPHVPSAFDASQPQTPVQAVRNLLSSDAWRKSPSWWTGWRWTVSRDAYACFFAAFDVTRRLGLRVKAFFGGNIQAGWDNFLILDTSSYDATSREAPCPSHTNSPEMQHVPTIARVAQATTIVTGGVAASLLAEMVGRPFRACQKIMILDKQARLAASSSNSAVVAPAQVKGPGSLPLPSKRVHPILQTLRAKGLHPFLHPDAPPLEVTKARAAEQAAVRGGRIMRMAKRVGYRLAAVGPWGMGFLVWAWVGGEV